MPRGREKAKETAAVAAEASPLSAPSVEVASDSRTSLPEDDVDGHDDADIAAAKFEAKRSTLELLSAEEAAGMLERMANAEAAQHLLLMGSERRSLAWRHLSDPARQALTEELPEGVAEEISKHSEASAVEPAATPASPSPLAAAAADPAAPASGDGAASVASAEEGPQEAASPSISAAAPAEPAVPSVDDSAAAVGSAESCALEASAAAEASAAPSAAGEAQAAAAPACGADADAALHGSGAVDGVPTAATEAKGTVADALHGSGAADGVPAAATEAKGTGSDAGGGAAIADAGEAVDALGAAVASVAPASASAAAAAAGAGEVRAEATEEVVVEVVDDGADADGIVDAWVIGGHQAVRSSVEVVGSRSAGHFDWETSGGSVEALESRLEREMQEAPVELRTEMDYATYASYVERLPSDEVSSAVNRLAPEQIVRLLPLLNARTRDKVRQHRLDRASAVSADEGHAPVVPDGAIGKPIREGIRSAASQEAELVRERAPLEQREIGAGYGESAGDFAPPPPPPSGNSTAMGKVNAALGTATVVAGVALCMAAESGGKAKDVASGAAGKARAGLLEAKERAMASEIGGKAKVAADSAAGKAKVAADCAAQKARVGLSQAAEKARVAEHSERAKVAASGAAGAAGSAAAGAAMLARATTAELGEKALKAKETAAAKLAASEAKEKVSAAADEAKEKLSVAAGAAKGAAKLGIASMSQRVGSFMRKRGEPP